MKKPFKPILLAVLGTVTASVAAASAIANATKEKDADTPLIVETLDATCAPEFCGPFYDGVVTSTCGDDLYITVTDGFNEGDYFLGLDMGGTLMFVTEPVKGIKSLTIKGSGTMYVGGGNDPNGEVMTYGQTFTLDDSQITLDLGVGFDYFAINADNACLIEEISMSCTCSLTEITDEYYGIMFWDGNDFVCSTVDDFTNASQVSTRIEIFDSGYFAPAFYLGNVDLSRFYITYDIYSTAECLIVGAEAQDETGYIWAGDGFTLDNMFTWTTYTLTADEGVVERLFFNLCPDSSSVIYIDNIRVVAK